MYEMVRECDYMSVNNCPFCGERGRVYAKGTPKKYGYNVVRYRGCKCGGRWVSVELTSEDYEALAEISDSQSITCRLYDKLRKIERALNDIEEELNE